MIQQDDPDHSVVAKKLRQVAIEAFHGADRDNLTLKSVREKVEKVLGLEKGILRSIEWKDESKAIIEHTVQQLLEAEEKELEQKQSECDLSSDHESLLSQTPHITTTVKKQISKKRSQQSTDDVTSERKRLKSKKSTTREKPRAHDSYDRSSSEQEKKNNLSRHENNSSNVISEKFVNSLPGLKVDLSPADNINEKHHIVDYASRKENIEHDSSIPEETEYKIYDKAQGKAVESRVIDKHNNIKTFPLDLGAENSKEKDTFVRTIRPNSELLLQSGAEDTLPSQSTATNHDLTKKDNITRQDEDEEAIESDMSVVIDEEPPEKRKKKSEQNGGKKKVGKKVQKIEKKSSSDEEMLKKLQSQLRKCGVKTIWHFILKEYGEDTQAKIRHLQKALKDIGMQGRFSETRAREIKESRELKADLEAVKEGDMKWGLKRNQKHEIREQNEHVGELSVHENSDGDLEVYSAYDKEEFKGKKLRNNTLKRKSTLAVQQPRRRSTALDWLGDEESSEG